MDSFVVDPAWLQKKCTCICTPKVQPTEFLHSITNAPTGTFCIDCIPDMRDVQNRLNWIDLNFGTEYTRGLINIIIRGAPYFCTTNGKKRLTLTCTPSDLHLVFPRTVLKIVTCHHFTFSPSPVVRISRPI